MSNVGAKKPETNDAAKKAQDWIKSIDKDQQLKLNGILTADQFKSLVAFATSKDLPKVAEIKAFVDSITPLQRGHIAKVLKGPQIMELMKLGALLKG